MKSERVILMKEMVSFLLRRILCTSLFTCCSSQFLCPPAEIGSSVELICNHSNSSNIFVNTPLGPTAVACTPTCSDDSRFTGSYINETQTHLTILKVEHRDRGTWTCQYGGEEEVVQCNLNLYKIPSCKISSDQDTSSLTLGLEISLYLNVNNAYCDEDTKLTLTSGDDVHIFTGRPGVNFSETFNTSYIVTDKHMGPVRSSFQCGNQILNISCSGVTNLERAIPLCTLSSDKDTEKISLDEEVSLSMKIHQAYCSKNNTFTLVTGNTTHTFTGKPGLNLTFVFETRFNVTSSHIGSVRGSFWCLNQVWSLNCTGVHVLAEGGPDSGSKQEVNLIIVVGITLGCLIPTLIVGVLIGRAACQRRRKM